MTKVLAESGVELSQEELLDAIWLAGRLPRDAGPLARSAGEFAASSERHGEPHHDGPAAPVGGAAEPASEPDAAESADECSAHPLLASARPGHDDTGAAADLSPAVALRIPDSSALGAGQLGLGRSLRPLRQRFPDRRRQELDVPRTVAAVAETGVPETVTRAVRSRWLSLVLVVDDGISMTLWQRLAADVRALMERAGAFRDVRVLGLDSRGGTPSLRTGPYRHRGRPLTPEAVCDPAGDTLVLVVSDGVGEAWRDGGMRRVMDRWGRCGPTAIVQALPFRLWASTGIDARRWQVTTHRRGGPTSAWHVTDPDLPPDLVRFDSVPVPVLTPTPAAVADWAGLVASPGGTALLPLWEEGRPGSGRVVGDARHGSPDGDAAEAVLRFKEAASAEAYRLAAHMAAVTPVTPPVMRLVQAALGPPTDLGHLVEVFLGGLMHECDTVGTAGTAGTSGAERLPQHRRYDFTDDARRLLLSAVSPRELLRTAEAVTRRIETAVGRAPVFPAWVGHPDGAAVVEDPERSFGWLREQVLTRLGIPSAAGTAPVAEPAPVPAPPRAEGDEASRAEGDEAYGDARDPVLPAGWTGLLPEDPVRLGRFRLRARSANGWPHLTMFLADDEDGTVATVRAPVGLYAREPGTARDLVRTEAECLSRMRGAYTPALLGAAAHTAGELPWVAASCVHRRAGDPSSPPAPNLRAVLEEHGGTVPGELFLRVGLGLTKAVALAHSRGLVHGSLSPRAVLVTDRDVRLVGWATATVDGVDSAHRDVLPLSDTYLRAGDDGRSLAAHSDVYAVGALLLAFLSGSWSDPNTDDLEQRLPADPPFGGPVLLRTLRRCLAHDPARRPSATELAEAFALAASRRAAPAPEETARSSSRGPAVPVGREGALVGGRYRLVRPYRAGASSVTWRATDELRGGDVTLKIFTGPGDGGASAGEDFLADAKRLAALDIGGVVRISGHGLHDRRPYLVTDAVDGEELQQLLETGSGALPLEQVREVGRQIADILAEYHRNGLSHLDLTPAALVLRPDGRVLLTDPGSGIRGLSHAGEVPGDHRDDLYALGCLLYAMATGVPPATTAPPPRAAGDPRTSHLRPGLPSGLPPEFAALVTQLMAADPEDRPATAAEVGERLASAGTADAELIAVHDAARRLDPDGRRTGRVLRDTIDEVLAGDVTGRYDLRQLTKVERGYLGSLVTIAFQREFAFEDGRAADFRIAGVDVDIRYSQRLGGWSFAPGTLGRICLLVCADDHQSRWSVGLLRVRQEWLNTGRNRDMKATLAARHRDKILWLWRDADLSENVLLHMSDTDREAVLGNESGQVRINELFRRAQGRRIGRTAVRTVARQRDYMKRIRLNGGARTALGAEGIIILGDSRAHRHIARQLGLPVPGDGEFVSARVVPAAPASGRPVAEVDGRSWSLASPEDPVHPAPALPAH
ncbi:NaeI family type II restriction endonuclease [Streptomyces sp. NPDC050703]|uniref:NaeI family type II restriction endonuclease n=1 Tax=Streptomyces sp. NPDC050703 TaxID=3157218 RepID=UPI0034128C54